MEILGFVLAKNKLFSKQLESKTILEMQAVVLGVETLIDVYGELCDCKKIATTNVFLNLCYRIYIECDFRQFHFCSILYL